MVYVVCDTDKLSLWWDVREDKTAEMRYKIIVNNKNCVYTHNRYYYFRNLKGGQQYDFQIQVVDEAENVIGRTDYLSASTLPARKRIDVTLPPYNAVGDGKTDNTSIIQRAIDENPLGTEIYLPFGVFVCGKLTIKGDYNLRLDSGATLKDLNAEDENDA